MNIGYRIIRPEDVETQPLSLAQISLWRKADWGIADGERAVNEAIEIAVGCKERGIRTVFHPLDYPLATADADRSMEVMQRLAERCDLGLIIHDEGGTAGNRLSPAEESCLAKNLARICGLCPVSIENAFNSGDITWFWDRFVAYAPESVSITIDIGHLESAGIDSIRFLRDMPQRLVERVRFVHMHHKAEERYGIKDHWPLVPGCREIEALNVLLKRKPDVMAILELDAKDEGMQQSIALLKELQTSVPGV